MILIVDDCPLNRVLAAGIMKVFGIESAVADCSEQALEILQSDDVNIVLTDVMLPDIDGSVLTRTLKSRWPSRNIQVIAMTASACEQVRASCLEAGVDAFITKPYTARQLSSVFNKLGIEHRNLK